MHRHGHHFYKISGMFAIVAGVVGLSGVITTFEATMEGPPPVQPRIEAVSTDSFSQILVDRAVQGIGFAIVEKDVNALTVRATTQDEVAAQNLQFAFVPRVADVHETSLQFDVSSPEVQDAAIHAIEWQRDNSFTFPIDESLAGKWITIYAFVKNNDEIGAAAALPAQIDSAGAIIFHVPTVFIE